MNDLVDEITEKNFADARRMLAPVLEQLDEVRISADEDLLHKLEQLPKLT